MIDYHKDDLIEEYKQIHAHDRTYGMGRPHPCHHEFVRFLKEHQCHTVLDYGCGKGGRLKLLEQDGFEVQGFDPAVPEFSETPTGPFDGIVSDDVFEHFHPHHVLDELITIKKLGAKAHAFRICTIPALKVLPNLKENLHTVLHSAMWWVHVINAVFPEFSHRHTTTGTHVLVYVGQK